MLNLNRRGSMSVTSINNGSLDSVFTEEVNPKLNLTS